MRATSLFASLFFAALSPFAQATATLSPAQAERKSVDLRQGMSSEEVEKLPGKPRRTALKSNSSSAAAAQSQGSLQWTYSWPGTAFTQGSLHVVFAAKAPEQWSVNSWEWGY